MKWRFDTYWFFSLLVVLFMDGCTEAIEFEVDSIPNQIVIVGSINTLPGPYRVSVTKAIDFFKTADDIDDKVTDAQVIIYSDDGQEEVLTHNGDGIYETSIGGIRGEIGRSYSITVISENGEVYQSTKELITDSPEIDSVYFKYEEFESNKNNVIITKKFASIMIDTEDNPEVENYYAWNWNGTYKFSSFPELFTVKIDGGIVLAPKPCSFNVCSCCECWHSIDDKSQLTVGDDTHTNGSEIIGQEVAKIPITYRTFGQKYLINVKQRSLTKKAFEFWSLVKNQETASTISATPPAKIIGNISNINNPNETVWGYFSASDVSQKSFYITRKEIPTILLETDSLLNDCRSINGATTEQPLFWK